MSSLRNEKKSIKNIFLNRMNKTPPSTFSSSPPFSPPQNNMVRPDVPVAEIQDVRERAAKKRPAAATENEPVQKFPRVAAEGGASIMGTNTCRIAGLKPGDRVEVRWDLRAGYDGGSNASDSDGTATTTGGGATVSRWWGATLLNPDGRARVNADDGTAAPVRVLDYDSRHEHDYGFPHRALEDVVFLSDHALLHLSHPNGDGEGGGRAYYRREGSVWEPPLPAPHRITAGEALDSVIVQALREMSQKMTKLDATQRRAVATRIAAAREKMLAKLTEQTLNPKVLTN